MQRLGQVYLAQGKAAQAGAQFDKILTKDPRNVEAWAGTVAALMAQKQPEKAIQRINQQLSRRTRNSKIV